MTRVTSAVLLCLVLPASAFASLGGTVATVENDRVQMKSALVRISRSNDYSVHELLSPTGTTIREYYASSGVVFGVAWDGEWPPALQQVLGTYFNQYQRAVQSARHRVRGRVAINEHGLVVLSYGQA